MAALPGRAIEMVQVDVMSGESVQVPLDSPAYPVGAMAQS
jgi:hypothetical protein